MPKAEKLYERMKRTRHGWGQNDFETLYRGYGFKARATGGHTVYSHPEYPDLNHAVGRHNDLGAHYAETAVEIITDLLKRQEEKKRQEEEARKK